MLASYTKNFIKSTLQQLYILVSYIRLLLEYGSHVWSGITQSEEDKIKEIQRSAIRIIAGLKIGTSHGKLFEEVDIATLEQRRHVARMLSVFDIQHCEIPGRLNKESVTAVGDRNPYNTRRGLNISLYLQRTEHLRNAFLNKAIREWNNIPDEMKRCTSRSSLKRMLKHKSNQRRYYEHIHTRMSSVNLARLRCSNHNLNGCLFDRMMSDTAACDSGHCPEDPKHFFIYYDRYAQLRRDVTRQIPFEA